MTEELKIQIQKLISEENFEEAIKLCDEAIEKDDKDEEAYFYKANCKFELKDYNSAIEDLNKAIEINPNDEKSYSNRGLSKSYLRKYEESIEDYNKSIEINPNNEMAYINRGFAKSNLGKYEESIEDYNKVIELNPNNEKAYFSRGLSKSYLRKYKESIEDYNKAIEINPNYINAYINIAISNAILNKYDRSMEYFDKAISKNKDYASIYLNRGIVKAFNKKHTEAIEDFNIAIKLDNCNNPIDYFNKSKSLYNLELYEESIENAEKAINLYNKYIDAHYIKILSKAKLKKYIEIIEDFNNVAKINSNFKNNFIVDIMNLLEVYSNIETIFQLLIKNENNILWRNEPITNLIFHFDESKNFDDELIKNIKYLLLYEYFLLKILSFDTKEENNNIEISHYTSLNTLFLLLNAKEEKELKKENPNESENIRINNITTANDPKEGKILERILNKNDIDIKIESDEKAITLQTSYSRNKDSLTMFRLYGKKENKEATGICLVLNNEYFDNSYTSPYNYESKLKIENDKIKMNEKINKEKFQENKRNLYWVIYYNEKENQLVFNKKESKYSSNIIDLNNLELKEDNKIEDTIKYVFSKIFYYTKEIKNEIENKKEYKNIKNKLYSYLFENIKYIIKHEAFFEEQELRMLATSDYKSDEILIDNENKKLYIDYITLFNENTNYIKEIIIGSKVENNEAIAEYIRKILHSKNTEVNKLDNIKVSISKAPLR